MTMDALLTLSDFEAIARERVPTGPWGYYRSGADSEITLRENEAAWQRLQLLPRVLVDVAQRNLGASILDQTLAFPVLVAPTACHGMAHPEGEVASARAAATAGTIFVLSTLSNRTVEEVAAAGRGAVWFQLYVSKDRQQALDLVARVEAAGCRALVITVDAPVLGRRLADVRGRFSFPEDLRFPNLYGDGRTMTIAPELGESALSRYVRETLDPSLTWRDLEAFAARTRLPIFVKGIHRADDARRAFDHGAAGIVVSNHGGRQLDTVPPTADLLPAIAAEVGERGPVLVDGGIRKGTDVLKAIALGARAVLLGRPILWGLASGGEEGVRRVLEILHAELDRAMALAGCADLARCTRDLVRTPDHATRPPL